MIRKLFHLIPLLSIGLLLFSCSGGNEYPAVTSCDNDYITDTFTHYEGILNRVIEDDDCETLLKENNDIINFIDNNYNCLIIYLVLKDDDISTDKEAEALLSEARELIESLNYLCEVENQPALGAE